MTVLPVRHWVSAHITRLLTEHFALFALFALRCKSLGLDRDRPVLTTDRVRLQPASGDQFDPFAG